MDRQEAAQLLGLSAYLDVNGRMSASDELIQQAFFNKNAVLQQRIQVAQSAREKEQCACMIAYHTQAFRVLLQAPKQVSSKQIVNVGRSIWNKIFDSLSDKLTRTQNVITSHHSALIGVLLLLTLSFILFGYALYQETSQPSMPSPDRIASMDRPFIEPEDRVAPLFYQSFINIPHATWLTRVKGEEPIDDNKRVTSSKVKKSAPVKKTMPRVKKKLPKHFVRIPQGSFVMGCEGKDSCLSDEMPAHKVSIKSFYLSQYEVTKNEFARFIKATGYITQAQKEQDRHQGCFSQQSGEGYAWVPQHNWRSAGYQQTDQDPVVCVSWKDIQAYISWLNKRTGHKFRLPSEAEWEYAARSGSTTDYYFGQNVKHLCLFANVADQSSASIFYLWPKQSCLDGWLYTAPVGQFKANKWSLYDMHGNVWEWVDDCWRSSYHKPSTSNPACSHAVIRGGSSFNVARYVRSAVRERRNKVFAYHDLGFRLAHSQ